MTRGAACVVLLVLLSCCSNVNSTRNSYRTPTIPSLPIGSDLVLLHPVIFANTQPSPLQPSITPKCCSISSNSVLQNWPGTVFDHRTWIKVWESLKLPPSNYYWFLRSWIGRDSLLPWPPLIKTNLDSVRLSPSYRSLLHPPKVRPLQKSSSHLKGKQCGAMTLAEDMTDEMMKSQTDQVFARET